MLAAATATMRWVLEGNLVGLPFAACFLLASVALVLATRRPTAGPLIAAVILASFAELEPLGGFMATVSFGNRLSPEGSAALLSGAAGIGVAASALVATVRARDR